MDGIKEENVAFLNTQQGVQEAHFHFDDNLYNNCPDNVNLLGCYQTEKYFKEIEDVIRNDLQFQDDILKPCEEMMSGFDTRPIMLHVRRCDPNWQTREDSSGLTLTCKTIIHFNRLSIMRNHLSTSQKILL